MPELPPLSGAGPLPAALHTNTHAQGNPFAGLPEEQLLDLRTHLDALLPIRSLKDVNMETELVRQLSVAMKLQRDTLLDETCPANQKSQVLNAAAAAIATLGKLQVELYSSERLKQAEVILIETIQTLGVEEQARFLDLYEEKLGRMAR